MINHPVHIVDEANKTMLSAFIPFCSLGSDMKILGTIHPGFSMPVCSNFKPKVLEDQICYQLDIQDLEDKVLIKKGELNGLKFVMDYNEDRMVNTPSINENEMNCHTFHIHCKCLKRELKDDNRKGVDRLTQISDDKRLHWKN